MKRRILIVGTCVALAAATILAACGGGSSSGPMGSSPTATTMAAASGVITGFGGTSGSASVLVNGQQFATDMHTQIVDGDDDDAPSSTASLQVGMTVDVDGAGGTATLLRFTSAVRGEVDAVDTTGSTLTVLGQTVQVTSGTSFAGNVGNNAASPAPAQLSDIHVGDYVVVFGYLECPGTSCTAGATDIVATLVDEPSSVGMYRVQGYVSNDSASGNSFMINALTVDIATSGASPTVCDPTDCAFANGDFVAVRSSTAPTGSTGAGTLTLTAGSVKLWPVAPTFAAGTTVMIEGSLMDLSGTTFVVRGVTVDASASALATTVAALQDNQIVEVTGTIAGNGTLTATSIEVERYATFVMMGSLDSVSSSGFSLLGQSFSVTASTRFMDWAQGVRPFDSTDFASVLAAGNQVIVSGYPSGSGDVATRVERIPTPASPVAGVQGVVSADNAPTDTMMTVAGVTVTLNPACGPAASPGACTQLFYFGAGAMPTLAGFFGAITPNTAVAAAFGPPGSSAGTITAAAAAVLRPQARWMR